MLAFAAHSHQIGQGIPGDLSLDCGQYRLPCALFQPFQEIIATKLQLTGGLAAGLVDGKSQTSGTDILRINGDAPIGKRRTGGGGTLLVLSAGQGQKQS